MRLENTFVGARGVGERTERDLWERGVTHWDDVEDGTLGGKRGERLRSFVETARPHLAADDADFFAERLPSAADWRLAENFRDTACYFDIETTGLDQHSSVVTTLSVHRGGETRTYVRGDDLTADAVRREFDAADLLVSYNGKRFDAPFLEGAFDLEVTTPHLDLLYPCRRLDLTGGLKAAERAVGIEREADVGGREAIRLWHRYRDGDEAALDRLVRYNRRDAENLADLLDAVVERLDREVFVPHVEG